MSANRTFLAVFLGGKTSPQRVAWETLTQDERSAKERRGMLAWKAWMEKNAAHIAAMGGPLGRTKRVTPRGVEDTGNDMGAFLVVHADSHEEAADLFKNHPHFMIFPGEAVEIMPVLPVPNI